MQLLFKHNAADVLAEQKSERGVILILFLLWFVVMFVVAALAIDSGNLYRSKLQAQKAADASVLGGLSVSVFDPSLLSNSSELISRTETRAEQIIRENLAVGGFALPTVVSEELQPKAKLGEHLSGRTQLGSTAIVKPKYFLMSSLPSSFYGDILTDEPSNIKGQATGLRDNVNIVLMVDTSSSMDCPVIGECICQTPSRNITTCDHGRILELKNAINSFIDMFDPTKDRISLVTFASSANVIVEMNKISRGFDKTALHAAVNTLTAKGNTNLSDAMYKGYKDAASLIDAKEKVSYVLFSDGAPTAGRFLFTSDSINTSPDGLAQTTNVNSLGDYDYQQYGIVYGNPSVANYYSAPGQLVRWDTLAKDYEIAPDSVGSLVIDEQQIPACSKLPNTFDHLPSTLEASTTFLSVLLNTSLPTQSCINASLSNPKFYYHMPIADPRPDTMGVSYRYGGMDIVSAYGQQWAQLYYDLAVQTSDFLRAENGIIYAVGLGEPACISSSDPYQDVKLSLQRKDVLLTRIANDENRAKRDPLPDETWNAYIAGSGKCGYASSSTRPSVIIHPEFTNGGTINFAAINSNNNGKLMGEYVSTTNATNLTNLFRQIAIRIQQRMIE